ncbi:MAG TPA: hypothetical protein QF572_10505 [Vicinamibacterales bacterium]|nr:hypothetical protein [Vicinamibacterales bacterium]
MNTELPRIEMVTKTGDEPFHADRENLPQTLLDYWRWSGSDLVSNAQRGILAEFLVGSALQMTDRVRLERDAYDIRTPSGLKVEVKNSAYIQSWSQTDYSTITFDIAPKKSWDAKEDKSDSVSKRSADVYVFCPLAHRDQNSIDPLNVSQWEFYVAATSVLDERCGEQKTIRLAARGETPRCTENGDAPGQQGAPRANTGLYSTEKQRSWPGCSAVRMQRGFHHGLLGPLRTLEPEQPSYATLRETVERVGRRPSGVG